MKNDYLWDKTGEDAEIEQFEELLSGFRYVETDPPELPAMNIIPVRASWRSRFGWILTLGTATAAVVLAAFYFQTLRAPQQKFEEKAVLTPSAVEVPVSKNEAPRQVSTTQPATTTAADNVKTRVTTAKLRTHKRNVPMPLVARKEPVEKPTKEELYAYNQVKLALFITGAKLKTVSDVIERIESKPDASSGKSR